MNSSEVPQVAACGTTVSEHAEGADDELSEFVGADAVANTVQAVPRQQCGPPTEASVVRHCGLVRREVGLQANPRRRRGGDSSREGQLRVDGMDRLPVHPHIPTNELRQQVPASGVGRAGVWKDRRIQVEEHLIGHCQGSQISRFRRRLLRRRQHRRLAGRPRRERSPSLKDGTAHNSRGLQLALPQLLRCARHARRTGRQQHGCGTALRGRTHRRHNRSEGELPGHG
mmetsp:Transcript_95809/g.276737  ORF Transcript_95809/g.276737 Transcript_95809/m.276737 type:complete len:228 (-) Transcript_95809:309-992(-)